MSSVGQREILTQQRVIALFRDTLGYRYLGNWKSCPDNRNVEAGLLGDWLKRQGHSDKLVGKVLFELSKATALGGSKTLYDANCKVYGLLRYGVKVRPDVGEQNITVWLVDWAQPQNNDFAVAEEVTVAGKNGKRPDVVLYVNGIAVGVLELKRSTVSVTEGIRQNLDSQKKAFIRHFYSTVQLVMAGNDTEGLRYSAIETPEKYWLRWKEEGNGELIMDNGQRETGTGHSQLSTVHSPLSIELSQLCGKERLLEIIHDFIVFDAGQKKTCRHNQYFGVRAAQERIRRREGGIIWHTQGSGKSLTMVWLAKWIRENVSDSRVLIITDRTELDEQIEKVFSGVSESIYRTRSGSDLVTVLNASDQWLVGSLIHKFGGGDEIGDKDIESYVEEIKKSLPKGFRAKGEIFVFVDECHRTQSGRLHDAMKALLPGAMMIGFTGTPLLAADKKKSFEVFGRYIHKYRYDEAVRDKVVLDLRYEARDIDQNLTSQKRVDEWFEAQTSGLSDIGKAQLKQRWGTMQKLLSSRDRLSKIVADITYDMATRDRLKSGRGNAILVSDSVYSACRLYEMFQGTDLKGKTAIVTSYKPSPADIKGEETGEGLTEKLRKYEIYRRMLAEFFDEPEERAMGKVEEFEREVKKRFIKQPGQMKLLIVVDKLLTGFDAPPATYLYIDKKMADHGLFQAICRVNRLADEDKEYGYIVDYKDLFKSLEKSIKDYTGEAFGEFDHEDVAGLLKDRLEMARERLEEVREAIHALCEPVQPPRDTAAYIRFFCFQISGDAAQLKENEPKRVALYKLTASLVRAYANLANEMGQAGYSVAQTETIKAEVEYYEQVRMEVKLASGDYVDMKVFEPAMRHLLDSYVRAEESEKVSAFDDMTLVDLIVNRGEDALQELPSGIRNNPEAMAETIENNVRKVIIDEMAVNPKYYQTMSGLLDDLILSRKKQALDYREYLAKIIALTNRVQAKESDSSYPTAIATPALRALFDNLKDHEQTAVRDAEAGYSELPADDEIAILAQTVDRSIRSVKKAGWRGNRFKEREVRLAIKGVLGGKEALVDIIFEIVKNQSDY